MSTSNPKTESPAAAARPVTAGLQYSMAIGTAAVQAWMNMSTEAVRFIWDRLQKDIKTQQAMLACTSPQELQKVQAEFLASVQEQYAAEAGKMLEAMAKATTSALSASTTGGRRYDDVPL